ncbi:hypothetical protein Trydic_g18589 [Trypoxylus dichotomus]
MAENGQDNSDQLKKIAGSRPSSATKEDPKARLKSVKDRQHEERKKKLEEMQEQAMALQRFKEKKETERRQRMDELKQKEEVKRQLVEDRKRAINDAERDRLESILKRNQEREARIEAKKRNERHSMVFAFGSSTPRMLQPTDSVGSFWGHRRATSTQNITTAAAPLTRRQSERELDGGIKKRATSAGGLERSVEDMRMSTSMYEIMNWGHGSTTPDNSLSSFSTNTDPCGVTANIAPPSQAAAGCASGYVGRRRTDLMPTIPSRDSPSATSRKSFTRSPGRAYSMSRLDQLAKPRKRPDLPSLAETTSPSSFRPLNRPQQSSVSRSMSHLAVSKAGPQTQRPLRKSDSRSMHQLYAAVPLPPPRTTRATQLRHQKLASASQEAPSRPSSSLSQQSTSSVTSSVNMRTRPIAAPRRPRPVSIAVTGISNELKNGTTDTKKPETKPPLPKTRKSSLVKSTEKLKKKSVASPTEGSPKLLVSPTNTVPVTHSPVENKSVVKETKTITKELKSSDDTVQETMTVEEHEEQVEISGDKEDVKTEIIIIEQKEETTSTQPEAEAVSDKKDDVEPKQEAPQAIVSEPEKIEPIEEVEQIEEEVKETIIEVPQVSAEDEPVPALEPKKSSESQEKTDMEKKMESSSTNIGDLNDSVTDMTASMIKVRINTEEEAKAALAERRRLAREEAERQAEMERRRIEEEQRIEFERQQREEEQQRILIEKLRAEEQQRLEEAIKEAQKREEEQRLRKEEENRMRLLKEEAERRQREEAERQKAELQERLKNEEKEREERRKRVEAIMKRTRGKNSATTTPQTEEKNDENKSEKINGSKVDAPENGHKNGKEVDNVDNIIPVETLKNANTVNNVDNNLSTDDTLNSNNAWQHNTSVDVGRHF